MVGKTILSAAALLGEVLEENEKVKATAKMIYPVVAPEKAQCPYVVYRRQKLVTRPDKSYASADTAIVDILCCGANYAQSVQLAENVRQALDHIEATSDDGLLRLRSCYLTDAAEDFISDTFVQSLTFTIRI